MDIEAIQKSFLYKIILVFAFLVVVEALNYLQVIELDLSLLVMLIVLGIGIWSGIIYGQTGDFTFLFIAVGLVIAALVSLVDFGSGWTHLLQLAAAGFLIFFLLLRGMHNVFGAKPSVPKPE